MFDVSGQDTGVKKVKEGGWTNGQQEEKTKGLGGRN